MDRKRIFLTGGILIVFAVLVYLQFRHWRIFDIGAFAVLMAVGIFLPSSRRTLPHPEYFNRFRDGGLLFFGMVTALALGAVVVSRQGELLANWVEHRFSHWGAKLSHRIAQK